MSGSRDLLRAIAPQFEDTPDATLDVFLGLAAQRVGPVVWGHLYPQGVAYLAAHLLALRDRSAGDGGVGGAVTSVRTGDLSVGYAASPVSTPGDGSLASTAYGQEYMALRAKVASGPWMG